MKNCIIIKLFATLRKFTPDSADSFPISPGISVRNLIDELGIPEQEIKVIFIDGIKSSLDARLQGGERLGIFPPVGGG
jgi:molybdopterin converting factor small subunit